MSHTDKYNEAFELLGSNWASAVKEVQRHALIGVAEHSREEEDFIVGPSFEAEVMPICHGIDKTGVAKCLNEIRKVHRKQVADRVWKDAELLNELRVSFDEIEKTIYKIRITLDKLARRSASASA